MVKIRLVNGGFYSSSYSEQFLIDNWNNIVNGELVSEWTIIEADYPDASFFKPKWDGSKWIEGATAQEVEDRNNFLIEQLSSTYREQINVLVLPYLPDLVIDAIPIPSHVLTQRTALKAECNFLIQEIDPTRSMSKPTATQNEKSR